MCVVRGLYCSLGAYCEKWCAQVGGDSGVDGMVL